MNTDTHQKLEALLKELHLPTMRREFAEQALLASKESFSYEKYLLELVESERESRWNNRVKRLLTASKLPLEKSLASFERERLPHFVNRQLDTLVEASFLDRRENILAFGNPGSGKTHLLAAIGLELVHLGKRVLFYTCSILVQDLLRAKRDLELKNFIKKLLRNDVLIIDDIGYVQQSREEMEVLFTLLAEFYERRSLMISSNLAFSHWEKIFKDPMTTTAAIDRLVHHSIILELNVASYRLEKSKAVQAEEKND